ncbi:hypothetical protein [Yinghuangia seranimata]|uniref:hypothetical protein n=1 Tax=Yinghuangia seranimata TaxID=408067 RepID=UPI00248AE80F|nr:hypothetical protein [Yinghuangia seranimata]MDI2125830.1 hypothetical protein [Yinghuangia seranimata]
MFELVTALRLAPPKVAEALVERFRPKVVGVLETWLGVPEAGVERLLDEGAVDAVRALTAPTEEYRRELLVRVAAFGVPEVAARVLRGADAEDLELVDALLEGLAESGDRRWAEQAGLEPQLRVLLRRDPYGPLRWPFDELVRQAAFELCARVPYAVAVDLLVGVAERCGPLALLQVAETRLGHEGLAELIRAAAASRKPAETLAAARPEGEWTDRTAVRALVRIRDANGRPPAEKPPLDWELVRREHERRPFSPDSLVWLSAWPGCPDDLVALATEANVWQAVTHAARLPFEVVGDAKLRDHDYQFRNAMWRGVREGWWSAERVIAEAEPVVAVLGALPFQEPVVGEAVAKALAPLGTEPSAWLTLCSRIPRYKGPLGALVAEIVEVNPRTGAPRRKRVEAWPRALPAVFPATEPDNTRRLFLDLLGCVSEDVTVALAPHFDVRAVQHLLAFGTPSERVRDALVEVYGQRALVAYASGPDLPEPAAKWLAAQADDAVDAALFRYAPLTHAFRADLLAGRHHPAGPELLEALGEVLPQHNRSRLTAGIGSGDPAVARVVLERIRLATEPARLRLLEKVWAGHGPDAVAALLDLGRMPAATTAAVRGDLAAPDGLELLRARLVAAEAPDRVVAHLSRKVVTTGAAHDLLRQFEEEGGELPWPELAQAVRDGVLAPTVTGALALRPECTREFALAALDAQRLRIERTGRGEQYDSEWRIRLTKAGTLTPADLVEGAAQPGQYLRYVAADPQREGSGPESEPCAEARALTERHLGDDAEAWTVAVRLLEEFTGTLPELLAVAGAATRIA